MCRRVAGERLHLLPGGRIGVPGARQWVRTALGAAWYLGPWAWALIGLARTGWGHYGLERIWARRVARFLRIALDVEGLEHVDTDGRYVVIALHEGFADVLALLSLPLRLRFVVRDELFEWPLLGRYLQASRQVLIPTSDGPSAYRAMLRAAPEVLEGGESLVVFPQGSILGIEVAFTEGALRLAARLDRHVLPVVLTGSHRVWEHPYTPRLRYGQRISMRVLPPIRVDERGPAGTRAHLEQEMKRIALGGDTAPPRRFDPRRDGYWDGYPYEIDSAFPETAALVAAHRGRPQDIGTPPASRRNSR